MTGRTFLKTELDLKEPFAFINCAEATTDGKVEVAYIED